ncbi:GNAT family N-acetyltransferase [Bradyrhizobium sp. STM 3562]|uniref:GNAT family N-acetyltransferase n=1 Tax=Bradyrhizobium sp. STM 3562 TaxID=578924 RepID=UPI00389070D4
MTDTAMVRRASTKDAAISRALAEAAPTVASALTSLTAIDAERWSELSHQAIEPNGYYLPDWGLAVNASAPSRTGASALAAWGNGPPMRLIGLMPVISLWRAFKIPLPALVSAHPYGTLCTPLIDRDAAAQAAAALLQAARQAGARALILREVSLEGAAMHVLTEICLRDGLRPHVLQSHRRACLDATRDADALLREALGSKKLKELRRQRHRLEEHGPLRFEVARSRENIAATIEVFLRLEASGWKGQRGTALIQLPGDAAFIRRATLALADKGQCEIVTLRSGETPVAAGIVLRHQGRAFFFKIGVDERFAKFSPGVQLTLELTRHLCEDPDIASADSTASPDHPMINPIWRGRFAIGDVLIPLRRKDPLVATIHAALMLRQTMLGVARRGVRLLRAR